MKNIEKILSVLLLFTTLTGQAMENGQDSVISNEDDLNAKILRIFSKKKSHAPFENSLIDRLQYELAFTQEKLSVAEYTIQLLAPELDLKDIYSNLRKIEINEDTRDSDDIFDGNTNTSAAQTPEQVVEEIMTILQHGAAYDYIGEPVSQLEHALQCAQRAKNANADDETIVAALLHDIGHLLIHDDTNGLGAANHEKIGAAYVLEKGFSQKIADLIQGHVDAKRYLTFVNPTYYERLSSASKETLIMQGGPMTEAQALEFEQQPYFKDKLLLRTWDEQSKLLNYIVDSLESYRELLLKVLTLYQAAHYKKYCEYV